MKISQFKKLEYADYYDMSAQELKSLVQYGAKVLNRRINTLYRAQGSGKALASDALKYVEKTGGLFNLVSDQMRFNNKGELSFEKSRNELIKELRREIYFANLETSTVKKAIETQAQRREILEKSYSKEEIDRMLEDLSTKEFNKIVSAEWEKFHTTIEENALIASSYSNSGKSFLSAYKHHTTEYIMKKNEQLKEKEKKEEAETYEDIRKKTGYKPKYKGFSY